MTCVERKYPNLINCLGRSPDMRDRRCRQCRHVNDCVVTRRELEHIDFAPGRYRPGFGRWKVSKKYEQY